VQGTGSGRPRPDQGDGGHDDPRRDGQDQAHRHEGRPRDDRLEQPLELLLRQPEREERQDLIARREGRLARRVDGVGIR
jgi:hypothetical protein